MKGTIRKLVRNYGFITADDDNRNYFFHDKDLVDEFEVNVGDLVTFEVVEPEPAKGPRARDVAWQATPGFHENTGGETT